MRRTRWTGVLACFVAPAVLVWVIADLTVRYGGWFPMLTMWGAAAALGIAVVVLAAGLAVRRFRARQATWMTPTGAATTAVAAKASAIVGAIVAGLYAGGFVYALLAPDSPAMSSLAWSSGVCMVACALWCGVGLLVEHWCAIDMSDDDDDSDVRSGSLPSRGAPA